MSQWYVKDLSKIAGVSVRTLHHYDSIGLLKSSIRESNGYRVYSAEDLWRLQKIKALKYFGFSLCQIEDFLKSEKTSKNALVLQKELVDQKIRSLQMVQECLDEILSKTSGASPPWQLTIKMMEMYTMVEKLDTTWMKKVLSPEEMKELAEVKSAYTADIRAKQSEQWSDLISLVKSNLEKDPKSALGSELSKKFMAFTNKSYGPEKGALRNKLWGAYQQGKHQEGASVKDQEMHKAIMTWITTAMEYHYKGMVEETINQASAISPKSSKGVTLLKNWDALLLEMFSGDQAMLDDLDSKLPKSFMAWLKDARG